MTDKKPYYRLKQLITEKYGEEKFSLGCFIVAQWLNGEYLHPLFSEDSIHALCEDDLIEFTIGETEIFESSICLLFGLKNRSQLYNL